MLHFLQKKTVCTSELYSDELYSPLVLSIEVNHYFHGSKLFRLKYQKIFKFILFCKK